MPMVTAQARDVGGGEIRTYFIDTIGTVSTTFTYPTQQDSLTVTNKGISTITLTVNGTVYTIQGGGVQFVAGPLTAFTIVASALLTTFDATAVMLAATTSANKSIVHQINKAQKLFNNQNLLREVLIDGFESLTGWTTTNCTASLDTVNTKIGGASISIVQTVADTYTAYQKTVSLNFSDAQTIEVTVYVPDVTKLSSIGFYFYTASGNMYRQAVNFINGLNVFRFHISEFTVGGGTPTFAQTITKILINLGSVAGQTATIGIDSLKKNVKNAPIVTFVVDVCYANHYNIVRPIFDSRGVKFCEAVNSYQVGLGGYETLAQLQEMYNNGHDILNHSTSHADFSTLTYTQAVNEIQDNRSYLMNNGIVRGNDIYVHSLTWNALQEQVCRDLGIAIARDIKAETNYFSNGLLNGTGLINPYRLRTAFMDNVTAVSTLTPYVDRLMQKGGWLIFTGHDVAANAGAQVVSSSVLQALVDYCIASGATILPMSAAYESMFN